ncbi:unnamed protein product [Musa hybrid cultivar]
MMEMYELVKDIGSGNFGVARLMRNKDTGELVAMKYIPRGPKINENVAREIINQRSLSHPNIIRFKEVMLTPTHLAIVLEYAAGGELFDRICHAGRFSEDEVLLSSSMFPPFSFGEIFLSAAHLRRQLLPFHGKTSPQNHIFSPKKNRMTITMVPANLPPGSETGEHLARRQPGAAPQDLRLRLLQGYRSFFRLLIRFRVNGNSSIQQNCAFCLHVRVKQSSLLHSRPKSTVGTPAYIAPEVLSRREYDGKVSPASIPLSPSSLFLRVLLSISKGPRGDADDDSLRRMADVWSCGVTLYVMLVGAYPFEDPEDTKNFRKTMTRIMSVQYTIPEYVHISKDCRQLLSGIFMADPSKRITIREIRHHPWFLKNLPRSLTEAAQAIYYKRDNTAPTFSLQSLDEIMKIVEEARITPGSPAPAAGFAWAKEDELEEGKHENQETGVEEEEDDDEYDKRVKEVHACGEYPIN